MDKDTKVLLMAVVIILVALVSFNLNDLTGKAIDKDELQSYSGLSRIVIPSSVTFGWEQNLKSVKVDFYIGSEAVRNQVYLYDRNDKRKSVSVLIDRRSSPSSTISNKQVQDRSISLSLDLPKGNYYLGAKNRAGDIILESNYIAIK